MIRIQIKKNNIVTHQADFATQELADAWVLDNVANNSWGKPERWLTEDQTISEGLETINAADTRIVDSITEYKFLAEYSIIQEDATAEYESARAYEETSEAIALGVTIITKVGTLNKKKLKNAEWDAAKFNSLLVNPTMANIERACWNGSLKTAKALIQSLDNTYYTESEKAEIIALIDAHSLKWA
jgi:hypothetical protein